MGGYPRLWWRSGGHLDFQFVVPDAEVADFEEKWRAVYVRVEWLRSPRGRIDQVLPQTIERTVHNANVRSWREHGKGS